MTMFFLRSHRLKVILAVITSLVIFNEWVFLSVKMQTWKQFTKTSSINLLLVADPQILSSQTEPYFPFSLFAIWDANRFVSRTFNYAVQRSEPDVILFLGDLLNDGSVSNADSFHQLSTLFHHLLPVPANTKAFYVPGDNDIGGEGFDLVSTEKQKRFNSFFRANQSLSVEFVDFYHLNSIDLHSEGIKPIPRSKKDRHYNVLASHLPVMPASPASTAKKMKTLAPDVIFSAHDHDSWYFIGPKEKPKANQFIMLREQGETLSINLNSDQLFEISVPTCSYRMGKESYGFGHMVIGKDGTAEYAVLWLPSRFTSLVLYLIGACVCLSMGLWPAIHFIILTKLQSNISVFERSKYHRV